MSPFAGVFPQPASWRDAGVDDATLAAWAGLLDLLCHHLRFENNTAQPAGRPHPARRRRICIYLERAQGSIVGLSATGCIAASSWHLRDALLDGRYLHSGRSACFHAAYPVVPQVLEIDKWLALGNRPPVRHAAPPELRPGRRPLPDSSGWRVTCQNHYETAGPGCDVLCTLPELTEGNSGSDG